jgi:hypothetical protein
MSELWQALKTEPFDGINFYRNDDGDLEICGFQYTDAGEKIAGSSSGELYDIIIFPEDPPKMPEKFQAILISPIDYIDNMIDNGFLGVVSKVTTTSDEFVDTTFDTLCTNASEYIEYYEKEMKDV